MRREINALWASVRALQRKLARELAAYRLDIMSRDICHRWFAAQSDQKPLPDIQTFIRRVIDAGYRLSSRWPRPTTTCGTVFVRTLSPTPKRCSMSSFPRPGRSGLRGPLPEGKTWNPQTGSRFRRGACKVLSHSETWRLTRIAPAPHCYGNRPFSCSYKTLRNRKERGRPARTQVGTTLHMPCL